MKIDDKIRVLRRFNRLYQNFTVVGETSRSWLLVPEGQDWIVEGYKKDPTGRYANYTIKLAKVGLKKGDWKLGTEADEKLAKWALEHHYAITSRVQVCEPQIMIEVAKLVGFPLPEDR